MNARAENIRFEPYLLKVGREWQIVATYPSGHREHITGFKDEADALAWIQSPKRAAWVRARGYQP